MYSHKWLQSGLSKLLVKPEARSAAWYGLIMLFLRSSELKLPRALGRNNPNETVKNHLLLRSLIQKLLPCPFVSLAIHFHISMLL